MSTNQTPNGAAPSPRFAFEEAEEHFDAFAIEQPAEFQRAWMKTKFMVVAYAYGDYFAPDVSVDAAMARGWEELQIAFTGRGEAFLSGAVLHLWNCLPDDEAEQEFFDVVRAAWHAAEVATPTGVDRLYTQRQRGAVVRNPDDGFTLAPVLPSHGVRLREWELGLHHDPQDIDEVFDWLGRAEEKTDVSEIGDEECDGWYDEDGNGYEYGDIPPPPGGPSLRLLPGGLDE